jgi:uncharacterized protein (TIGR00251 family)
VKKQKTQPRDSVPSVSATLTIRIQPRASRNGIVMTEDGSLKIRLTAPPVDGAANEALIKFLSEVLGLSKSQVRIVTGHISREKIVKVEGISESDARRLLNRRKE